MTPPPHVQQSADSADLPGITVVIPAKNSAATLEPCLHSVLRQDYPADRLEVLLVDNGSRDATPELARAAGIRVIDCARPGPSAARNDGWAAARHPIVVFLDSDAEAMSADWLRRIIAPFADPAVAGVGGRIDPWRLETDPERHAHQTHVLDQEQFFRGAAPYSLPFFSTANAAYRREVLAALGGFDEALKVGEDADFSWRVQWAGGRLHYEASAAVVHRHRTEPRAYFRQIYAYGRGTVDLFAKHRARLGRSTWIEWGNFVNMLRALYRIPRNLLRESDSWGRRSALYDLAASVTWCAGRVRQSLRARVLVV